MRMLSCLGLRPKKGGRGIFGPYTSIRAIASVRLNFFNYFTLRIYFFFILHNHFSKTLTLVHLFLDLFYLNNNIYFFIFYFSFVPISLYFLLCISLYLCILFLSHLSYQSVVPFRLLLLPFMVTSSLRSPPLHKHLLFLSLMARSPLHHKYQSPLQAPQESKPTSTYSVDPQAPISAASTDL